MKEQTVELDDTSSLAESSQEAAKQAQSKCDSLTKELEEAEQKLE